MGFENEWRGSFVLRSKILGHQFVKPVVAPTPLLPMLMVIPCLKIRSAFCRLMGIWLKLGGPPLP